MEKEEQTLVCQICSDDVGFNADGEPFVACNACAFPVCRPCYEYERKDGSQACPKCKTKYKWHKGSPSIHGGKVEDSDVDDGGSDVNFSSENHNQKDGKRIARTPSWQMNHLGQGSDVGAPVYDKEVSMNRIPRLTGGSVVSGDLSAASPERASVASTVAGGANLRFSREFASPGLGNIAWKERVDGWKVKQEKSMGPPSISHAPSEGRFGTDMDASTDVFADEAFL